MLHLMTNMNWNPSRRSRLGSSLREEQSIMIVEILSLLSDGGVVLVFLQVFRININPLFPLLCTMLHPELDYYASP